MTSADAEAELEEREQHSELRRYHREGWTASLVVTARRQHWGKLAVIVAIALVVGAVLGRTSTPDDGPRARAAIDASILPVVLDTDGIWTAGAEGRAPVSDGLVALRNENDPSIIDDNVEAWLEAYEVAIVRLADADLPLEARPVQRQFLTAVTFSRDAVEVLAHAAEVEGPTARRAFIAEVSRLRSRSEQLMQAARASTADLAGGRTELAPLPPIPRLDGQPAS